MKDRKFWSFVTNAEGASELRIDGEIATEESWWSDVVTPRRFEADLKWVPGDLCVWINSPGGDAFAGAEIYTALMAHKAKGKVTVKIGGLAASAASVIAMAGDEVLISPLGSIFIHEPFGISAGSADERRKEADVLDEIAEAQVGAYARKTGKSGEVIRQMMKAETYISATMAVAEGFADGVLFEPEAVKAEAPSWAFSRREHERRVCALMDSVRARKPPTPPVQEPKGDPTVRARLALLAMSVDNNYSEEE